MFCFLVQFFWGLAIVEVAHAPLAPHLAPLGPQLGQQFGQEHHLARGGDEGVDAGCRAPCGRRARAKVGLEPRAEPRVAAHLAQLHGQVAQLGQVGLGAAAEQGVDLLLEHGLARGGGGGWVTHPQPQPEHCP